MQKSIIISTIVLLIIAVCFFCTDIPAPPGTTNSSADFQLFPENDLIVDSSGIKRIGAVLKQPQLITAISLSSSCALRDTVISVQSSNQSIDTIYFSLIFAQQGPCTLFASARTEDIALKNRIVILPLYVSTLIAKENNQHSIEIDSLDSGNNVLIPASIYAPENIISGKADTLEFAIDNSTGMQSIALVIEQPLDSSVFTVIPSGSDMVRIAINPEATTGKADIGIAVGDGTRTDTSWYPISIISQAAALWNISELPVEAIEGTETQFNCTPYLTDPEAIVISDIGLVSVDNIWTFTPSWGSEATMTAKLTAKTADTSMVLTLNITVPPGDTTPPIIVLADSTDLLPNLSPEIAITLAVSDDVSGVKSVTLTWGEKSTEAQLQGNNIYSGVITDLVSGVPTEVTVTATDRARAQNQSQLTFTVTHDETASDQSAPTINITIGPEGGKRVLTAEGTIVCTITDPSGVDSVWWTMGDDVFGGSVPLKEDGTYSFSYTLTNFGENVVTVHAMDGAANPNTGHFSTNVVYNVQPAVPVIESPETGRTGISTEPTLTWTGGDDPDADSVFYIIRFNKSTETVPVLTAETVEKSIVVTGLEPNTEYTWKVVAYTKTYPDTVRSEPANFTTAGTEPTILQQPEKPADAIASGGSFTLTVKANGSPEPTYQWYHNGGALGGKTAASLTVVNASKDNTGEYHVVVSNDVGEVISTTVSITIQEPVAITSDPEAQEVYAGENAIFAIEATGDGTLTYQWMKDGAPVSGQTSATCNLTTVTTAQAGTYTCVVSNGFSEKTSKGAKLTVIQTYTVTYNENYAKPGRKVPVDTKRYTSGQSVTLMGKPEGLSNDGYTFKGWSESINALPHQALQPGATISVDSKDVVLFAIWEMNSYTIVFDSKGGPDVGNKTVSHGDAIQKPSIKMTKSSYTFRYWSKDGSTEYNFSSPVTSGFTLVALWDENPDCSIINDQFKENVSLPCGVNYLTVETTCADEDVLSYTWYYGGGGRIVWYSMSDYDGPMTISGLNSKTLRVSGNGGLIYIWCVVTFKGGIKDTTGNWIGDPSCP